MDLKLYTYKARLSRVIDGDTVELNVDLGMSVSVKETFRLYGINAPEISNGNHFETPTVCIISETTSFGLSHIGA